MCVDAIGRLTLSASGWDGSDDVTAQAWNSVGIERWVRAEEEALETAIPAVEIFEARNHVIRRGDDVYFYLSSGDEGPEIMQSDIQPGISRKERKALRRQGGPLAGHLRRVA